MRLGGESAAGSPAYTWPEPFVMLRGLFLIPLAVGVQIYLPTQEVEHG